jgi:uncharacterized protein
MLCANVYAMEPVAGVEHQLRQWRARDEKPASFLETSEDVIRRLTAVPESELHQAIEILARDTDEPKRNLAALYEAWAGQDRDRMFEVISRSSTYNIPAIRNAVFTARNREWVASIERLSSTPKRTVVIVGAGHLCGPDNLLDLMGRHVTPVLTG